MSLQDISLKFTETTLKEIVKEKLGTNAKFVGWKFNESFKKGDSYLSEVFRVQILAKNTTTDEPLIIHTVIKSVPKNIARRKTFRSGDFFRNEINFYQKILKQCQNFQEEIKPEIRFDEVGKCLGAYFDGENDWIMMEDLTFEGFRMANRQAGMDYNHMKLALQTLGKFHGLSFVFQHQKPDVFDTLLEFIEEQYFASKHRPWYKEYQLRLEKTARHAVENEYPGSIYLEKLEKFFSGDLYNKMVQITHTRTKYSVLCHGDCWTPNFLFKYTNNNKLVPISVKMIDFQLARYASPALDVSLFFYACTDQQAREQYFDELLLAYHKSLSDLIKAFGSDPQEIFPFSALEQEMKSFARFGVGMGMDSIPFSVMDDTPDMDFKGDKVVPIYTIWIIKPIEKKEGRQRLADIFKHATDRGYLD